MEEGPLVMEALSNGAMTYIQKPEAKNIQSTKKELEQALHQAAKNTTKTRITATLNQSELKVS